MQANLLYSNNYMDKLVKKSKNKNKNYLIILLKNLIFRYL